MPSSDDDPILRASPFHEWWLAELRSSLAPTEVDVKPPEPEAEPELVLPPPSRLRPRGALAFACASGLLVGAVTMAVVDGHGSAHASAAPPPPRRVEGIVEIGEIVVVNPPRPTEPKLDPRKQKRAAKKIATKPKRRP
jgi:hypothetical protein